MKKKVVISPKRKKAPADPFAWVKWLNETLKDQNHWLEQIACGLHDIAKRPQLPVVNGVSSPPPPLPAAYQAPPPPAAYAGDDFYAAEIRERFDRMEAMHWQVSQPDPAHDHRLEVTDNFGKSRGFLHQPQPGHFDRFIHALNAMGAPE